MQFNHNKKHLVKFFDGSCVQIEFTREQYLYDDEVCSPGIYAYECYITDLGNEEARVVYYYDIINKKHMMKYGANRIARVKNIVAV